MRWTKDQLLAKTAEELTRLRADVEGELEKAKADGTAVLEKAKAEGRDLNTVEVAALEAAAKRAKDLGAERDLVDQALEVRRTLDEKRRTAPTEPAPGPEPGGDDTVRRLDLATRRIPAQAVEPGEAALLSCRMGRAWVLMRGGVEGLADAQRTFGQEFVQRVLHMRNQNASSAELGGLFIQPALARTVIGLLRNRTVVRKYAQVMPWTNTVIPKVVEGTSASYIGETQAAPGTQMRLGFVQPKRRTLAASVPISNELLRNASEQVDAMVRDELVGSFATAEDAAFLRGDGNGNGPRGLKFWCPPSQLIAADGDTDAETIEADLNRLLSLLVVANTRMLVPVIFANPLVALFLSIVRDANNNKAFSDVLPPRKEDLVRQITGMLQGCALEVTNAVPINVGTGGDKTEITAADMADVAITETDGMEFGVSTEAMFWDEEGAPQSAFLQNMTVIRAFAYHDFVMTRPSSVAVLEDVTWFATE